MVLGVPAAYDAGSDRLTFADHIPGWAEPETLARLRLALRAELVVENDVKLAAVWERGHGAARDADSFALLWVGTGVGLAVDIGGSVYTGATGGAGEIGYMRLGLRPTGPGPLPATFNDLVGAEAVAALAREHGLPADPAAAVAAARQDLTRGMPFLSELARRLAGGLAPIVAVLDPAAARPRRPHQRAGRRGAGAAGHRGDPGHVPVQHPAGGERGAGQPGAPGRPGRRAGSRPHPAVRRRGASGLRARHARSPVTPKSPTRFARLYLHLFVAAACVMPVASYVLATFGWRPGDIGIGTAVVGIAGTLSSPFWGRLDDRTTWAPRAAVLLAAGAAVASGADARPAPARRHLDRTGPVRRGRRSARRPAHHPGARLGSARQPARGGAVVRLARLGGGARAGRDRAHGVAPARRMGARRRGAGHGDRTLLVGPAGAGPADGSGSAPAAGGSRRRRLPVRAVLGVLVVTFPISLTMSTLVQFTAGWAHQELSAGPFLALAPIALSPLLELPGVPARRPAGSRPVSPSWWPPSPVHPVAVATAVLALFPVERQHAGRPAAGRDRLLAAVRRPVAAAGLARCRPVSRPRRRPSARH